jgi:hypothetical protein
VAPGSEQVHALNLGGLSFPTDPNIVSSNSVQTGGVGPWEMLTSVITGGAGGTAQSPGDYFYGDMRRVFTKAGMWGLQRVLPLPAPTSCPLPGAGIQCLQSPNTAPDAPTIGSATAGDTTASVSWTPPASDGGSAITGYLVRVVDASTNAQIGALHPAAASATSLTVTDLANGTGVALQVSATNSVGTGDPSALSATVTPTTPPTVPGAPTVGSATAGDATATLTWTAPASDGGSAITGYAIIAIDTAGNPAGTANAIPTATTATVTGLTNTHNYRLQVLAYNGIGTGTLSAPSNAVTPTAPTPPPPTATVPKAPTIGTPTRGNASALVRWTSPPNGGSAITGYWVRVVNAANAQVGALRPATAGATSLRVTGLVNGTAVRFQVKARNAVGTGALSAPSATITPATTPSAPRIGTATAGAAGGKITALARWSTPTSTGGSAITGYLVTAIRLNANGTTRTQTTSTVQASSHRSLTMTLPAGSYRFTVRARNTAGTSPFSTRSNLVRAR